jgi:hypothetical protein
LSGGGASGAVAVAVAVAEGGVWLGNLTAPIREREREAVWPIEKELIISNIIWIRKLFLFYFELV